jgi:nicotinic acid mononucleotide adenylyltransferase
VAHLAIAEAALGFADEVVWTLPRAFPHKVFDGAGFEERIDMLRRVVSGEPRFSVAVSDGGLYVEIAEDGRRFFGDGPEISLLCGRDAAERIANWDYGRPGVFDELLGRHRLLVAARAGEYVPDPRHAERIIRLALPEGSDEISSTALRMRIASGMASSHLIPAVIAEMVAKIYR